MCKMIVGITKEIGNAQFATYIRAQRAELEGEKDGMGALIVTEDGITHVFRRFFDYDEVFMDVDSLLPRAKLVSLHTRTGTSGEKSLLNVHFFEDDNHYFAHNGFVYGYGSYGYRGSYGGGGRQFSFDSSHDKELENEILNDCAGCYTAKKGLCRKHERKLEKSAGVATIVLPKKGEHVEMDKMCDSYQFLHHVGKPVDEEILENEIDDKRFMGMGFMFNDTTKEGFLMVKKDVKAQFSDDGKWGIFYSYTPDHEVDHVVLEQKFGVSIKRTHKVKLDALIRSVHEGVYKLEY